MQKYQCHVCMQRSIKPVVTPCGHLFCWICIYQWLRSNQQYLSCPICKSGLQTSSLRPVFIPNQSPDKAENGIPMRPQPRRVRSERNYFKNQLPAAIESLGGTVQKGVLIAGYGIFPSCYASLLSRVKSPTKNQTPFEQIGKEYQIYCKIKLFTQFLFAVFVMLIIFL